MAIIVTDLGKVQIRPRFTRTRFNDDAIKALGSNNAFAGGNQIITPTIALNEVIILDWYELRAHIASIYTNIVDLAELGPTYPPELAPPFTFGARAGGIVQDRAASSETLVTELLGTAGDNVMIGNGGTAKHVITQFANDVRVHPWLSSQTNVPNMQFTGRPLTMGGNNGDNSDYTGGNPANFLEISLFYYIVKVEGAE
jgi:hypothetical protein